MLITMTIPITMISMRVQLIPFPSPDFIVWWGLVFCTRRFLVLAINVKNSPQNCSNEPNRPSIPYQAANLNPA
jgi:hypothetical protein